MTHSAGCHIYSMNDKGLYLQASTDSLSPMERGSPTPISWPIAASDGHQVSVFDVVETDERRG